MSYIVNFTDQNNKAPITVYDNTSSVDTSLKFPGRNVTGYGQIIAENFLHLLENFANESQPINPVEGQLWYDSVNGQLKIWDNTDWKAASGIRRGPTTPSVSESSIGELWVDTTNQQLKMFTGSRWLLVGPQTSTIDGLRNGPVVEEIVDTENLTQNIVVFYIADIPVVIFSRTAFVPKLEILGFSSISAGLNLNSPAATELEEDFLGFTPKVHGIATVAESLLIAGSKVSSNKFMRTDAVNTTEYALNVRNDGGITVGANGTLRILNSTSSARIYNSQLGSSLDLQINRNGLPDTILRVVDNKVGINNVSPDEALDVDGNINVSGRITIESTLQGTDNLSNGSLVSAGGAAIAGNLVLGQDLSMKSGTVKSNNIVPNVTDIYNLGNAGQRWASVSAGTVFADTIEATTLTITNLDATANEANRLSEASTFKLEGDVASNVVTYDGTASANVFSASLTSNIIVGKTQPTPNTSKKTDQILLYRTEATESTPAGLYKQDRDAFVGDLGVPIGGIMPFAGAVAPYGFLLCDGAEVEQNKYPALYSVVGAAYNGTDPLVGVGTFRLPDLRGRFPLGKDNMDNGNVVPTSTGGIIDAGGGNASRIDDVQADVLGGSGGSATVTLVTGNLPDHTHDMKTQDGVQFNAVRVDSAIYPPAVAGFGPTAAGQAQYLKNSGKITKPTPSTTFSTPVGIINPFLTLNYIIRSGPPAFS